MQLAYNPYILPPLFAMLMAFIMAYRGGRYRSTSLGKTFLVLMFALAWWSLAVVMEYLSLALAAKIFWMKMSYFGITAMPVAWLVFALQYTDRKKWLTRRNMVILCILPVTTLIVVWTNGIHHLMWKNIWLDTSLSPAADAVTHNAWFWIYATFAYTLLLLGTLCLLDLFRKSQGIYRKQAGTLLLAALVPWVGNFLFIVGVSPFSVVDPTPLAFAITGVAFFWGLSRLQLLNIMPIAHDTILRSMVDGVIVLDTQQRVVELNPAAQNIIERNRSEVIGQLYNRVLPGQLGLLELKPDMTETQAVIAMGEGQQQRFFRAYITQISAQQHLNGHLVILHDDTERMKAEVTSRERAILETELNERKRAADDIQRRLEFEETIAKVSSRFVGISDMDSIINASLADIGRLSQASRAYLFLLRDKGNIMDNTHEWCADGVRPQIENLKNIPCEMFPWWMTKLGNGEVIHIADISRMPADASAEKKILLSRGIKSVLVLPVFTSGNLAGFIGFDKVAAGEWDDNDLAVLRISSEIIGNALERKQAAEQLVGLNEELMSLNLQLEAKVKERTGQLEEAVSVAKASNQAKSEFLASMSHELRTPLNSIIGFSQVLHEHYFGDLNDKQAEYVSDIVDSGKHLLSLINDILDLSKIEAGKMELEVSGVKIADLLKNSLVMIKEKALVHSLSLEIQVGEDINGMEIVADERRLKQVMFNLLSNAAKFTPDGGAINVQAIKQGKELIISVSDTGIGMTPQEQQRLFEAFYQASGGIKDKTPGTGLGLAITKSIVEKHGGRIWMESEGRDKGSRFTFTLPIDSSRN